MAFNQRKRLTYLGYGARMRRVMRRRVFLRPAAARAALTTALTGTNNDVIVTALYPGVEGSSIRFRIVVAGVSTAASVAVSGLDITFNSATSAGSVATSTGAQMIAAVNADPAAAKLVFLQNAAANDGTGVIAALAFTNLTGGA
jgi:hypothetical protein